MERNMVRLDLVLLSLMTLTSALYAHSYGWDPCLMW